MVLNVYPYGNQGGYGTHLSLYIYIVKGEYDQQLKWPFLGEVTVTLVDQRLGKHTTDTLRYTRANSKEGARRFNNTLTGALGWSKFIELKYLNPNYLKDDCFVFRINDSQIYVHQMILPVHLYIALCLVILKILILPVIFARQTESSLELKIANAGLH